MGKDDIGEITNDLREFYGSKKGLTIPQKPSYSDQDIAVLANADAAEIIRGGFDEVVYEADRLKNIGYENMTARDKALFVALTNHIKEAETTRALTEIGVTEDVYNSQEYKDFAKMFNPNTPAREIYELYRMKQPKKEVRTMGSVKNTPDTSVKDYYSPEEIAKLTEDDLRDPKVWANVRRSMTGG